MAVALAFFGVGGLVWTVVSSLLHVVLPRATGARVGRWSIHWLFRIFLGFVRMLGLVRVDLGALDRLRGGPPMIIAPNHLTLLDAVLVISRVPNVVCIMKAKIWDNPVLGGGARLAGYIRNDSPRGMVRSAARELRQGTHLLVFPEGTRTERPPVNPFKGGFAVIARRASVPVQTVILESSSGYLGKRWPLWRKPVFPLLYRASLGERFVFREDEDAHGFVGRLERYFAERIGRAREDGGAGR